MDRSHWLSLSIFGRLSGKRCCLTDTLAHKHTYIYSSSEFNEIQYLMRFTGRVEEWQQRLLRRQVAAGDDA